MIASREISPTRESRSIALDAAEISTMQKPSANDPISFTVRDAERNTGISRSTLFVLIREGKLASAKVGQRRLILASSLRRYLEEAAAA